MGVEMESALIGAVVGGLISGFVTWLTIKYEFKNEEKVRKKEDISKTIIALISIKNEIKGNQKNLTDSNSNFKVKEGGVRTPLPERDKQVSTSLPKKEGLFEFNKVNTYIDIIESNLQSDLTDNIINLNHSINNMYKIELKLGNVETILNDMSKLITRLELEIKRQREKKEKLK
jgi:hypothetical protein